MKENQYVSYHICRALDEQQYSSYCVTGEYKTSLERTIQLRGHLVNNTVSQSRAGRPYLSPNVFSSHEDLEGDTSGRRQSNVNTINEGISKIVRNRVYDCHLSSVG